MDDVLDRLVDAGNDLDRDDRRQKFGVVILFAGWRGFLDDGTGFGATADFDALFGQHVGDRRQQHGSDGTVDEQRFGGVAGAVALGLGVLDDFQRLVRIGFLFQINVAVAVQVLNHRHARLGEQAGDQALAAARDDDVDEFAHRDELTDGGAISGVDHLYRFSRQAGGLQAFLNQRGDGAV